jgi:replicative DNA helicase
MADPERSLLGRTLQTGELSVVVGRGIEVDHFVDPECRDIYEYMLWFQRRHKDAPSLRVVKDAFPDFSAKISTDPLTYHIDRFVNKVRERKAIELVRGYHEMIEDPEAIEEIELHALDMARQLSEVLPAPRAHRFSDMEKRVKEYERRAEKGEIWGTYMGIPTFDRAMLGMLPHEFVVFVAYTSGYKSTMMMHIAYSAYLQGKTVLFVSLEMEGDALLRKFDTMASKVKYHAMKALELETGDIAQWYKIAEQAGAWAHERDIIIRDDLRNCTVDKVLSETLRYKPDIIVVDYLELMNTPRSLGLGNWEKVQFSGQGLKQNARLLGKTHVSAAQLNREGGKEARKGEISLANVSYQSIGKDSDVVIGLAQSMADEEEPDENLVNAILLKNRDGMKNLAVQMRCEMSNMDINELGKEHRFPERTDSKPYSPNDKQQLMLARNVGGKPNPWREQNPNPWTTKTAA